MHKLVSVQQGPPSLQSPAFFSRHLWYFAGNMQCGWLSVSFVEKDIALTVNSYNFWTVIYSLRVGGVHISDRGSLWEFNRVMLKCFWIFMALIKGFCFVLFSLFPLSLSLPLTSQPHPLSLCPSLPLCSLFLSLALSLASSYSLSCSVPIFLFSQVVIVRSCANWCVNGWNSAHGKCSWESYRQWMPFFRGNSFHSSVIYFTFPFPLAFYV